MVELEEKNNKIGIEVIYKPFKYSEILNDAEKTLVSKREKLNYMEGLSSWRTCKELLILLSLKAVTSFLIPNTFFNA
jgi:hypothetical protein